MAPWAINTHFLRTWVPFWLCCPAALGWLFFGVGVFLWLQLYRSRQFRTVCNTTRRMINYNCLYLRLYPSSDVSAELSSATLYFISILSILALNSITWISERK